MSKRKSIELTVFNGKTLSTGEKVQPSVSGTGAKTTVQGTPVERPQNNTPTYKGYEDNRTYKGSVACLNLIFGRAIPSFPTSDRSAPSTFVVVYPDQRGSIGATLYPFPMTFHYKEWREIVVVAKEYKDSAFIISMVDRKDYESAIQHLEIEIRARYLSAKLIPSESDKPNS